MNAERNRAACFFAGSQPADQSNDRLAFFSHSLSNHNHRRFIQPKILSTGFLAVKGGNWRVKLLA